MTSPTRCTCCRKKLTLTDMPCGKCALKFCGHHRLPEAHQCSYDFRAEGKAQLEGANPRVVAEKVAQI